jgi:acylphosphatase
MSQSAVRVRIEGRVQGVWFRAWTAQEATARGLDGWVRNRADGTVEALFKGPADAVEAMVEACREGPPSARVTGVAARPTDAMDAAEAAMEPGFHQLPTG